MKKSTLLALAFGVTLGSGWSAIRMPSIFSDHMVLERSEKVPVWGFASPNEAVGVTLGQQTVKATADANGKWMVTLNLEDSAPGPFEVKVAGENTVTIHDVMVGTVWVASGQSNMQMPVNTTIDADKTVAQSANNLIREYRVPNRSSTEPLDDTEGRWVVASPQTLSSFSAVGYFFARMLQMELKVPVGIINTSWGGTPSEAWTSVEAIDSVPDLKAARERLWKVMLDYAIQKKAFTEDMTALIKANGLQDKPSDVAAFAGETVSSEGWTPVKLPGMVKGSGLPEAGVVWLRKEIEIPQPDGGLALHLPIDGFDSVYWNGKLLNTTTVQDFAGNGSIRRYGPYNIPGADIKSGKNVLAVRLYEPTGPARFSAAPRAGSIPLAGDWHAKAEFTFTPPSPDKPVPQAPTFFDGPQNAPGTLFNAMVNPLIPYAIQGAIWYQGESNTGRSHQYRTAFPLMIKDWRKRWGQGDFPFYFVQLANFLPKKATPAESGWAELREAQSMTLAEPNTGQAVIIDIGESDDIHPRNKKDVGERLAAIALARDFDKDNAFSGPTYEGMKVDGDKVVLSFKDTSGGLVARPLPATYVVKTLANQTAPLARNSPQSELEGFAICGEDRKWVWADAKIEGDTVVVWADMVKAPIAVRYAWADNPTCNLFNGAGFPASPFRTDDFPPSTLNSKL